MLAVFAASGPASAQNLPPGDTGQPESTQDSGGWRRVSAAPQNPPADSPDPGFPAEPNQAPGQPGSYPNQRVRPSFEPNETIPAQLTIRPGTFVTVRIDQTLSSDHNQPGDAFSATLVKPVVVDGIVVAQRGQTVAGRVVEAQKAGRAGGDSRLAIQLTDLALVDGQQVPVKSQFMSRATSTPVGREVGTVVGTTAVGAAIGAAADWGRGAAIGAGAGAAAGVVGVLLTRGHPTVIYPESVLTFRIDAPIMVATDRAPQAFRFVSPDDYEQPYGAQARLQSRPPACTGYGCAPPPYYYGYFGPGYYGGYPYYWGPGFSFFYGPRFYGPRFSYGPRFNGRGFRR
jgi:hypothetical protein